MNIVAWCSNWARNCLQHDVCMWAHTTDGGLNEINDADCGDEWWAAADDYSAACLGSGWWNKWDYNRCELYDANKQNLQSSDGCDNPN